MSTAMHVRNLYFWQPKLTPKTGEVVLITGAASGIGREIASIYAKRTCHLILLDMDVSYYCAVLLLYLYAV